MTPVETKSGLAFGLDKDVAVPMRDGAVLRANVFRPLGPGAVPVLMTFGPYGKDVHIADFMPDAWQGLNERHPEILAHSTGRHLVFETPDPEAWVPHGYAIVKVDSRGAGKSPGRLDPNSPAEFRDFFDAIEWAGTQPWSNGKVGLLGISYYAAGQWMIASMRPPHLAAIVPWQGASDFYRDRVRQGGIFSSGFTRRWWPRSVLRNQHGNPESPFKDIVTGERNTGPASLTAGELAANRVDYVGDILAHPLDDAWYRARSPKFEDITLPALVVANYGGLGLHLRGTIEGWQRIASREKWLKVQPGSYFLTFLHPDNVAVQRRFLDRYLKGIDNGWEQEPKVEVDVRTMDDRIARTIVDDRWPVQSLAGQRLHLAPGGVLASTPPAAEATVSFDLASAGVTFRTAPLDAPIELAGPAVARLWVSSATEDMDLFVTLRAFGPDGREAVFYTAIEPKAPVSQGWLRVSQRKLDPALSTPWRPFHTHDERQPLGPGEVVAVDVEIWPMSLALPKGAVLELVIASRDFERPDAPGPYKGSGFFLHDDPLDRPPARCGGPHTIYMSAARPSAILLPVLGRTA
jgi:predicted acyl esterase